MNSGNVCGDSSRSIMRFDTTTLAAALACMGTFSNSRIDEELDKIDSDDLCRVPTEDTCDTKSWNECKAKSLNEFKVRPLLDEDTTISTCESYTNRSILDDSISLEGSTKALTGKDRKLTKKPSMKGKPLVGNSSKQKERKLVRSVTITSSRKGTVEASLNPPIPGEDAEPKKKSIRKPLLKNKLAKYVRKYKSNEEHHDQKIVRAERSHLIEAVKRKSDTNVLTKVSLQIRPTDKGSNNFSDESACISSSMKQRDNKENESEVPNPSGQELKCSQPSRVIDTAPPISGGDNAEVKSEAPSPSAEELNSSHESSILAGFEISRIATNLISIIDQSLLQPSEETPPFSAMPIEEVAAGDTPSPPENEKQLETQALHTVSVRTFYKSSFGEKTMMPEYDCSNDEEQILYLSPKPIGDFDVLNDNGLRAPRITVANRLNPLNQKTEGANNEEALLNRTHSIECSTDSSHASELRNNIVMIEETMNQGDGSEFEAVYTIRPPYKMSRDTVEPTN